MTQIADLGYNLLSLEKTMFYDQAEFDYQVGQYLLLGMNITDARLLVRENERQDEAEYRRWADETALEFVE